MTGVWPSGIGGAQCDQCGATTVVRRFPAVDSDFHTEVDGELLCRPCVEHVHWFIQTDSGLVCGSCRFRPPVVASSGEQE